MLATAVDRFAYVTVQPFNFQFFDHGLRVAYRRTEEAKAAGGKPPKITPIQPGAVVSSPN